MPNYEVTIRAIITKTYTVEGPTAEKAAESAHELFSVLHDNTPESYSQDTVSIDQV